MNLKPSSGLVRDVLGCDITEPDAFGSQSSLNCFGCRSKRQHHHSVAMPLYLFLNLSHWSAPLAWVRPALRRGIVSAGRCYLHSDFIRSLATTHINSHKLHNRV